jgi:hypothetical protein
MPGEGSQRKKEEEGLKMERRRERRGEVFIDE